MSSIFNSLKVNRLTQRRSKAKIERIAQSITVVIWDARNSLSGSGVLITCDEQTYTVLTSRHVIEDTHDIRVITPDGQQHFVDPGCIRYLPDVDIALLQFKSDHDSYSLAKLGDCSQIDVDAPSFIAGFPVRTTANPKRKINFTSGKIVVKTDCSLGSGYMIACDNTSLPGMSGGPVLNKYGELIGINGATEDVPVPINAWSYMVPVNTVVNLVPDFDCTSFDLATIPSTTNIDYLFQGIDKNRQGDAKGAIADFTEDIRLHPSHSITYLNRGATRSSLGDNQGAIDDYNKAIHLNPNDFYAYINRGAVRCELGDTQGSILDSTQAIALNPKSASAFNNRGFARLKLDDIQGAIEDYTKKIAFNPDGNAYITRGNAYSELGDTKKAIKDYRKAAVLAQQQDNQAVFDQLQAVIKNLKSA